MKRFFQVLLIVLCPFLASVAQAQDIELTDSTSSEWGGGGGGGFHPQIPDGPVMSITISNTALTLKGGERVRLVANVNQTAANKSISWSSANVNIASVSANGIVRGLKRGTTTITATADGNTDIKAVCTVTVTSDLSAMRVPNVPFEFCFDATDYDESTHSIPNHPLAKLADNSLKLTENLPTPVDSFLRINNRCKGYIDKWDMATTASGAYFYRQGQDCMTLVAKVAPRLGTGNACDFITNRGWGYNYMWRIGERNTSFLHTGRAFAGERSLPLQSEKPQILAVRVDGVNNYILLQNLTTGESRRVEGVDWGGSNNVFKFFYNDDNEFFLGDFYWVYYSFELLTDKQMAVFTGDVIKGDANGDGVVSIADVTAIINKINNAVTGTFVESAADVNEDGLISIADVTGVINIINE